MTPSQEKTTQAWIDTLAGRPSSNADLSETERRVASALRQVVQSGAARDVDAANKPLDASAQAARDQRREAYLAKQGIDVSATTATIAAPIKSADTAKDTAQRATSRSIMSWFDRWLPASNQARFAMVAGLAAVALALPIAFMFDRSGNDPLGEDAIPGYRGKSLGGGTVRSATPNVTANEIEAKLLAVGAAVRRLERDGNAVIEAKIPAAQIAAARASLQPLGIVVTDNGIVAITVVPR